MLCTTAAAARRPAVPLLLQPGQIAGYRRAPRRRAKRVRRALLRHDGGGTGCDAERPVVARPRARCCRVVAYLPRACGDFVVRRADGLYAYQLAVSVDDGMMGITHVLRGRDLLSSTAQQIWLIEYLGYPAPQYTHVPMLIDGEGRCGMAEPTATAYYPIWRTKAAWYPNGPAIRWKSWCGAAI